MTLKRLDHDTLGMAEFQGGSVLGGLGDVSLGFTARIIVRHDKWPCPDLSMESWGSTVRDSVLINGPRLTVSSPPKFLTETKTKQVDKLPPPRRRVSLPERMGLALEKGWLREKTAA
jgi:hypothetical protein